MSVTGGPDALSTPSRNFYENVKVKLAVSILMGGYSMFLLAWCCQAGGQTTYYDAQVDLTSRTDDNYVNSLQSQATGYGFACFFYFVGFVFALAGALFISPLVSGSVVEKTIMKRPQELDAIPI